MFDKLAEILSNVGQNLFTRLLPRLIGALSAALLGWYLVTSKGVGTALASALTGVASRATGLDFTPAMELFAVANYWAPLSEFFTLCVIYSAFLTAFIATKIVVQLGKLLVTAA